MPSRPSSPACRKISRGKMPAWSHSSAWGASSRSTHWRAVARKASCSAVKRWLMGDSGGGVRPDRTLVDSRVDSRARPAADKARPGAGNEPGSGPDEAGTLPGRLLGVPTRHRACPTSEVEELAEAQLQRLRTLDGHAGVGRGDLRTGLVVRQRGPAVGAAATRGCSPPGRAPRSAAAAGGRCRSRPRPPLQETPSPRWSEGAAQEASGVAAPSSK